MTRGAWRSHARAAAPPSGASPPCPPPHRVCVRPAGPPEPAWCKPLAVRFLMQSLHLLVLGAVLLPRLAGGTTADDICPPGADPCVLTSSLTVTPASMLDFGNRAFQIASGRRLTVNDLDKLTIRARTVTLQTGAAIGGPAGSRKGATVDIVATGDIQLQRSGGSIDLAADVTAGAARLTAGG